MKRSTILAVTVALVLGGTIRAAEGMWEPKQLPELAKELKAAGLEIDPATLTDLTDHPMNAVIDLAGCSASFVSPKALVITNHHCSWGTLQYASTPENDLRKDGFLAKTWADEVPAAPGSRVRVTVEVTDVTDKVSGALEASLSGAERYDRIEERQKKLIAACEEDEGHRCRVQSFYGGLRYNLVKQLEIRDVRLVYAPPGSIGDYGGDIDNWMWPRHTGDFSFLRAYVGPDGKPADYAEENVPYEPEHYLRVSPAGVDAGDYVMVVGYPGRTNRYRLPAEVESTFEWSYPRSREQFDRMLEIIAEQSADRPDVELKYASMVSGINNVNKNRQGMLDGYAGSGMLERKNKTIEALREWIGSSDERRKEHASTLARLNELIAESQATRERDSALANLGRSSMLSTARRLYRLSREREKDDADREPGYQERDMVPFKQRLQRMDRRYHPDVDKALWSYYLEEYRNLPADQRVAEFDAFVGLDKPSKLQGRLDKMYEKTELDDTETRLGWMEKDRAAFEASDDPFIRLAVAMYDGDREREAESEAEAGEFQAARSRYMETMLAFLGSQGKAVYPDANSSLRVTYGNVRGYSPRDGMVYTPFTKLEGITEKDTGEEPFDSPKTQLELIAARDHGGLALASLGSVPVNFLSDVDTTGGNSGSPTLNGRGELVGLLFDGTYDSINADWDFNASTTRSIHVDIRYTLWVMDKIDKAHNVLEELGLGHLVTARGSD
ncbi:MAG: S46 family peptidase [Acidobacteria bacterium]|nr:S46 family peptidase [Acidobacteriota bacterium]NIM62416.1 S46 family peptidase [Acidobacteriota bacterium]NIO60710.1 S46 family peptidase [Acidobacteriota bacterium]NIQ31775.1 S46 family peptidase [Acidobacteriota bacterium]NIQ87081.1 S46 family peptidase [Acidobacteriota bacterium]